MMDTIAQRLLESAGWGLKMRLYMGAGLSMLDMGTDLFMIYTYMTTGQASNALSLGIMVGLSMGIQLFMAVINRKKAPARVLVKELLIVLSGLAPGVHAMRVAGGKEAEHAHAFDSDLELIFTRVCEVVFESVPGGVVQMAAYLENTKSGTNQTQALVSILISALTTGFSTATICFDLDVNPKRRRDEPSFYGYVPDSASRRTLVFLLMIANGALLLLLRSISTALLLMIGWRWACVYFLGDMGIYYVSKLLRGDFWHWIPLEGAALTVFTVMERTMVKVLVDFTGAVHFRGACSPPSTRTRPPRTLTPPTLRRSR
jgi:hypothetical protein